MSHHVALILELHAGMRMLNSQVKAFALPKPRSYKPTDPHAVFKCSIILWVLESDLLDASMQAIQLFQLFSLFFLANASPLPISIRVATSDANTPQCPSSCVGTLTNESLIHDYVWGGARLGRKRLPAHLPLGSLLDIYDQFGADRGMVWTAGTGVQYELSTDILNLIAGGFIERVDLTSL
jgi:hypothetical protein